MRSFGFAWPLFSCAVLVAASDAIEHARRATTAQLPHFADFALMSDAAKLPFAWAGLALCVTGCVVGLRRRSQQVPAVALLLVVALVHYRALGILLSPPDPLIDARLTAVIAWTYLPQALAALCLVTHAAIAALSRADGRRAARVGGGGDEGLEGS